MSAVPSKQRAMVVHKPGGPEALTLTADHPVPAPKDGHVLIKVRAFGLNRAELHARGGFAGPAIQFPRVVGIECAGTVVAAPNTPFKPGQTVVAMMTGMGRQYDGSYEEYTRVPAAAVHRVDKPDTMTWKQFGALPEMYQTTNGSLQYALQCEKGQVLLVRGGTSSIGLCAIALASRRGIEVVATSRSKAKFNMLKEHGATNCVVDDGKIAPAVRELYPEGVDRVLELIGTPTLHDSMCATKAQGVVCMTGCLGGWNIPPIPDIWGWIPTAVRLTVYGGGAGDVESKELEEFVQLVHTGKLKVAVDPHDFELKDLQQAHELMESNKARGKVVCVVKDADEH